MKQFFATPPSQPAYPQKEYRFCPACGQALIAHQDGDQPRRRCPNCGFVHYHNPAPGVVILIEHQGKILLGKRGPASYMPGTWCLPGGFIEFEENFLTAAHREVYEETGLSITIEAIINVCTNFLTPNLHTLVVVLLATAAPGSEHPGDDLTELGWFSIDDPLPPFAFESDEHLIRQYVAGNYARLPIDPRYRALSAKPNRPSESE